MNDILEPLTTPCGKCGEGMQVTWCPAWLAYLCVKCRAKRNEAELRVPVAEHIAMQEPGCRSVHVAIDLAYLEGAP